MKALYKFCDGVVKFGAYLVVTIVVLGSLQWLVENFPTVGGIVILLFIILIITKLVEVIKNRKNKKD